MNKILTVSPSPHVHSGDSTRKIMYRVVYAMLPALAWSVFVFGMDALRVTLIAVTACLAFEYLIQKYLMKIKPSVTDGSALITGMLMAFNVPSNIPWWIIIIGSMAAIGIGKIAASVYPQPAIVRMSDFKSNEYRGLLGGEFFELQEENPMLKVTKPIPDPVVKRLSKYLTHMRQLKKKNLKWVSSHRSS